AEVRKVIQQQPVVVNTADTTDIIGFDVQGPGSEERASIALLRKPLATLKDEEVRGLKEEVDRLRKDIKRHQAEVERRVASVLEEADRPRRRGRPPLVPAPAGSQPLGFA